MEEAESVRDEQIAEMQRAEREVAEILGEKPPEQEKTPDPHALLVEGAPCDGRPDGAHGLHVAGPVFGLGQTPGGQPQIMAQIKVCCRCGRSVMTYVGIVEPDHGPYVHYEASSPIVGVRLELPHGAHRALNGH